MNFGEALEHLRNGLPVRRRAWRAEKFIGVDLSLERRFIYVITPATPWVVPQADILADDWEIR